jgi:hypothetical protein
MTSFSTGAPPVSDKAGRRAPARRISAATLDKQLSEILDHQRAALDLLEITPQHAHLTRRALRATIAQAHAATRRIQAQLIEADAAATRDG